MARSLAQRILVTHLLKSYPVPALPVQLSRYTPVSKLASQRRLLHRDEQFSDHTCSTTTYDDYRTNHKPIIQIMVQTLKEILDTSTADANKLIAANPLLKKRSRMNVLNNYYNLLEAGVQKATIVGNIWLLAHKNDKLKAKLDCISVLNMNNDELVPWLRITQDELANFVYYIQSDNGSYAYNKIEHLAHRLECSVQELCESTIRCSFLLKIPISHIDKKLDILYEYDMSNKSILNDLWIFRYSENHIRHRCELYKNTHCLEIKAWAIRCPLRIIARAVEKNQVERSILQKHNNIYEYLVNKLNIDKETFDTAVKKWPGILRVNAAKLNKLISILQQNGIKSKEILRYGNIFYYNIETVQRRIEILKKEDRPPKLTLLTLTEKVFDRNMKKYHAERELLKDHKDVKGFLMSKLNIDEQTLKKATDKWPAMLRVNVIKLEQLINLLEEHNITRDELLAHGRVFWFNIETLRKRLQILKQMNIIPKITVITFSQKSFDQYVISKRLQQ